MRTFPFGTNATYTTRAYEGTLQPHVSDLVFSYVIRMASQLVQR